MKITTFNPDGSIKEVREHHFQIPNHIVSFDSNQSFLNITNKDLLSLEENDDEFTRGMATIKLHTLFERDLYNYIIWKSKQRSFESDLDFINSLSVVDTDQKILTHYSKTLGALIKKYSKSIDSLRNSRQKLSDDEVEVIQAKNIVKIIVFKINNLIDKGRSGFQCFKSIVQYLHGLYYALGNCYKLGLFYDDWANILYILRPFSKLNPMKVDSINDLKFFKDFVRSLYETGERFRAEQYSLFLALNYTPHIDIGVTGPPKTTALIGMTRMNDGLQTIMSEDPANGVEMVKAELEKEEITALFTTYKVSDEIKESIKDVLDKQYSQFCAINSDYIKKKTEKDALLSFKYKESFELVRNDWEKYYFDYLDNLQNKYKDKNSIPFELETPLFYYYVLVEECEIGKKYTFDGAFLDALLTRFIQKNGQEPKMPLYEQMSSLNYIVISADLINDQPNETDEAEIKRRNELRSELEKLCSDPDGEIAKKLLNGNFKLDDENDAVRYFLKWLTPIISKYPKDYINEESKNYKNDFDEKFEKILQSKNILNHLLVTQKRKYLKNNLNVKLVLNIIGYLSEWGKENFNNILKRRIGSRLEKDIKHLWNMKEGADSYHKYVSGYEIDKETSNLTLTMEKEIRTAFETKT